LPLALPQAGRSASGKSNDLRDGSPHLGRGEEVEDRS
jgi:hypothetical protein